MCKIGNNIHYIKDNLFPTPPLFKYIQESSQSELQEMYAVFNMGHRMEIMVDEKIANDIIAIAKTFDIDAKVIGYLESNIGGNKVTIKTPQETLHYLN